MIRSKFFAFVLVGMSVLNISSAGVQTTFANGSVSAKNQAILDRALERYVYAPVAEKNIFQKVSILETRLAFMEKKFQNPNLSKSASASIEYIVSGISAKIADLRAKIPYASQEAFKKDVESKINTSGFKQQIVTAIDTFYNQQLSQGKYELFYASTFLRPEYRLLGINNAQDFATAMKVFKPTIRVVSLVSENITITNPKDTDYLVRDEMTGALLTVTSPSYSCEYISETQGIQEKCPSLTVLYAMDGHFYTVDTLFPFRSQPIKNTKGSKGYSILMTSHPSQKGASLGFMQDNRDKANGDSALCFDGSSTYGRCDKYAVRITDKVTGTVMYSNPPLNQSEKWNHTVYALVPGLVRGKQYNLMITKEADAKEMYFYGDFVY